MNIDKQTPGEWTVLDNRKNPFCSAGGVHVIADGALTIASITYQLPDNEGESQRMANARLISKAKEMRDALKFARNKIIELHTELGDGEFCNYAIIDDLLEFVDK